MTIHNQSINQSITQKHKADTSIILYHKSRSVFWKFH